MTPLPKATVDLVFDYQRTQYYLQRSTWLTL